MLFVLVCMLENMRIVSVVNTEFKYNKHEYVVLEQTHGLNGGKNLLITGH